MNKYLSIDLNQIDDAVCVGQTLNNAEDLHDLAVAVLRMLANMIEKRVKQPAIGPDDARINLAIARRRMYRIDALYSGERHPPIEFSPK